MILRSVKRCTPKIGILTWHYYANVGSNLQAYAMLRALAKLGYDAEFVNYRHRNYDGERGARGVVKSICNVVSTVVTGTPRFAAYDFQRRNFRQSRRTYDAAEARALCGRYAAVICGSDQIWAPNVFDPVYMLEGVSDGVRKVSYAASIGLSDIPEGLRLRYRELLSGFDAVSVREEQARTLLHDKLGIEAACVLDPTFLLTRADWDEVSEGRFPAEVFCYFLGDASRYAGVVALASEVTEASVTAYLPEGGDAPVEGCEVVRRMGPSEFLARIRDARLVLTDSFHGIALSVNYGTDFVAFERFASGSAINQNSRVYNILGKLGLEGRLCAPEACGLPDSIDWVAVGGRLEAERISSWAFLREALGGVAYA